MRLRREAYRCDHCGYSWLRTHKGGAPQHCPRCRGASWTKLESDQYLFFRAAVERALQEAGTPLAWSEIRARASLPQQVPSSKWIARLQADIGLVRATGQAGKVLWSLPPR